MTDALKAVVAAMIAEIDRQHAEEDAMPYVGDGLTAGTLKIDGEINVEKLAQAALQAAHDAGFAVVPREPTEAMRLAGRRADPVADALTDEDCEAEACVYRAMIQGHQPLDYDAVADDVERRFPNILKRLATPA